MRIVISLEPECEKAWFAEYIGFSVPGYVAASALLEGESILGHHAQTYEYLMQDITADLPRSTLKSLPQLTFSENIADSLRHRTQQILQQVFSRPS
ncbi:MAG: hypothetical protein AABY00_00955 [Nanoarchaeota archaeon]